MATNKVKFRKYYETHDEYLSDSGNPIKQEYQLVIGKDGLESFEKSGETNIYDEIQSYADSVDVNKIVERANLGDDSALNKVQGFYTDVSNMQVDFRTLYNLNIRGEQIFDALPADVKQVFDNSYYKFVTEPNRMQAYQQMKNNSNNGNDSKNVNTGVKAEDVKTDDN